MSLPTNQQLGLRVSTRCATHPFGDPGARRDRTVRRHPVSPRIGGSAQYHTELDDSRLRLLGMVWVLS